MSHAAPTRNWTAAQLAGITIHDRSLLVSAAAGSGKTAVLAERCAYLVCDAPEPCEIDELLVVTYTEPAAAEMKQRILQAVRDRIARAPQRTPRLERQLAVVEQARVSTLHGFCARLLRSHFQLAELDPNFRTMDGDEAALLRADVCREVFESAYDTDDSGAFQHFVDQYGDGRDEGLMSQVLAAHELLNSLIDPPGWRETALTRLRDGADSPLAVSQLGREFLKQVRAELASLAEQCKRANEAVKMIDGFAGYVEQLRQAYATLRHWTGVFETHGLDALSEEVCAIQFDKAPSFKAGVPGKERAKALLDGVKDAMKEGALRDLVSRSESEIRADLRATVGPAKVFLDLVERFGKRYAAAKRVDGVLDFADLERFALNILREGTGPVAEATPLRPSAVARACHRQFKFVLVDEYQDINEIQDAILTLVSREVLGVREREAPPNLFAVGDVKQSIFRFRLAEPARFLDREKRFRMPENQSFGTVVDLRENFRSRGDLLGAVNSVFQRLMTASSADIEYDQTHELRAGTIYPPADPATGLAGAPVELHVLPKDGAGNDEDDADATATDLDRTDLEAIFVARQIRTMIGMDGGVRRTVVERQGDAWTSRPIQLGDIVILLRSLQHKAGQFASALREHGIAAHSTGGTGFFDAPEIRDMLALLHVLDNRRQDVPLASVLRSPLVNFAQPEDAMARVRLAYKSTEDAPVAFHEAVIWYASEHDDELAARLREVLATLDAWRELAHTRPLAEVIWTIYDESGFLAYVEGLDDGAQRAANLLDLHRRAAQFGTFSRQGLYRFLRFLTNLERQSDPAKPNTPGEVRDVVRVLSIHKSKGLEFPVVFVPDLGKRFNLSDTQGNILVDRRAFLGLHVADETLRIRYPSLASRDVSRQIRRATLAEEMRLLYVAMTRAKERLILIGTASEKQTNSWPERWLGFTGPMPADEVLGASTPLDWLGPVVAMTQRQGPEHVTLVAYSVDEVRAWSTVPEKAHDTSERQRRLAALEPLSPEPAMTDAVTEAIARVTLAYPFRALTTLAAATSVTSSAKSDATRRELDPAPVAPLNETVLPLNPTIAPLNATIAPLNATVLPVPLCVRQDLAATPVDKGTATHLVLQHLDWKRPCDEADVRRQADELVGRKLMSPAQAAMVETQTICWLAETDLGQLIRANLAHVRREVSFYLARSTELSTDPQDQVMVRGRLDLLLVLPGGAVIVDYKTDHVWPGAKLDDRVALYTAQMRLYAQGVQTIAGKPVGGIYLVFLAPRLVIEVKAREG